MASTCDPGGRRRMTSRHSAQSVNIRYSAEIYITMDDGVFMYFFITIQYYKTTTLLLSHELRAKFISIV